MVKTLGIFKRENNECSRNREKTKLPKIKIVVFFNLSGAMTRISSQKRHYEVTFSMLLL